MEETEQVQDIKSPTMESLLSIKKEREEEAQRIENEKTRKKLAISLDICPECGSPIIREDKEPLDTPKRVCFGLFVETHIPWGVRKICSKDKSHYEYKYNFSSDYYGY